MKRTALLAAGLATSLAAFAATPLNVKTGQWEITVVADVSGAPPIPAEVLAQMTPEQQAQMAALFSKGAGSLAQPHTSQECVTEEDLAKPFEPQEGEKCETTVLNGTATMQDIAVKCTGKHPATGKMHIEASSPESVKATIDLTMMNEGEPMEIKSRMTGKWLGPTCKSEG